MNGILSANQYISSSGIVTVYLLMIVFAVLAFLVVVLTIGHKVSGIVRTKLAARKAAKQKAAALPQSEAPAPVEEDDAEVAAITAAVYMMLASEAPQKKAKFVVRKIERI